MKTIHRFAVVLGLSLILLHFRLAIMVIVFSSGFLLGFAYSVPDYADVLQQRLDAWKTVAHKIIPSTNHQEQKIILDELSINMRQKVNLILDLFMRDFIDFWYKPLNLSKSVDFNSNVRIALNATILNAKSSISHAFSPGRCMETCTVMLFSFANTLIVHLREYRIVEKANRNDEQYTLFYTDDMLSKEGQLRKLKSIASLIVQQWLYTKDEVSPALKAIVTELVATSVLDLLVQRLSDPHFINQLIVEYLGRLTSKDGVLVNDFEEVDKSGIEYKYAELNDIIHGDRFNDFAIYLESQKSPAYLRFWTNVDFFKRFSCYQPGLPREELQNNIRSDAKAVFEMHFLPSSELPIPLVTTSTLPILVEKHPQYKDKTAKEINSKLVSILHERIMKQPSIDCFDESLELVFNVLQHDYLPGFLSSTTSKVFSEVDFETFSDTDLLSDEYETDREPSRLDETETVMTSKSSLLSDQARTEADINSSRRLSNDGEKSILEPTDALKHLVIALSNLREQHMHVSSTIDSLKLSLQKQTSLKFIAAHNLPNIPKNIEKYGKINKLLKSKKNLELEIERVTAMINEVENYPDSNDLNVFSEAQNILDLSDMDLKISDATHDPSSPFYKETETANPFVPSVNRLKNTVFLIQVEKRKESAVSRGWIFYRTYQDFQTLDDELKEQFAKVAKILLPAAKKSLVPLPIGNSWEEKVDTLCTDLQSYLQMLLVDQLLAESRPMQNFFKPKDVVTSNQSKSALAPELRKKLSSMLKSISKAPSPTREKFQSSKLHQSPTTGDRFVEKMPSTPDLKGDSQHIPDQNDSEADKQKKMLMDVDLFIDTCFALMTEAFDLHTPTQWVRRKALGAIRQVLLQQSKTGYVYSYLSNNIKDSLELFIQGLFDEKFLLETLDVVIDRFWPPSERMWYGARPDYKPPQVPTDSDYTKAKEVLEHFLSGSWLRKSRDFLNMPPPSPMKMSESKSGPNLHSNISQLSVSSSKSRKESVSQENRPASAMSGLGTSEDLDATMQALINLYRIAGKQNVVNGIVRLLKMLQHPELNRIFIITLLELLVKILLSDSRKRY